MGHQCEVTITKVLAKNTTLLRFGFTFEGRGQRHTANKYIMRNNDSGKFSYLGFFLLVLKLV